MPASTANSGLHHDRHPGAVSRPGRHGSWRGVSTVMEEPDGASATWAASLLSLSSARDALTLRLSGDCTGDGCAALAGVRAVSVTFTPSPSITDAAGNPAAGRFTKCANDVLGGLAQVRQVEVVLPGGAVVA
jgi:hypothetical protein